MFSGTLKSVTAITNSGGPPDVVPFLFSLRAFTTRSNCKALTGNVFGGLDPWSLVGGGRLQDVVPHGGSTK